MGLDPGTPVSCPGLKAGIQPLSHSRITNSQGIKGAQIAKNTMKKRDITHQPPEAVDVVKLIKIICLKGNGNEDPIRKVERYYDLNGTFIFEKNI